MPVSRPLNKLLASVNGAHQNDSKTIEPLDLLAGIVGNRDSRLAQLLQDHGITHQRVKDALDSEPYRQMEMRKAKLLTRDGEVMKEFDIPPMELLPEIVRWQGIMFVLREPFNQEPGKPAEPVYYQATMLELDFLTGGTGATLQRVPPRP